MLLCDFVCYRFWMLQKGGKKTSINNMLFTCQDNTDHRDGPKCKGEKILEMVLQK